MKKQNIMPTLVLSAICLVVAFLLSFVNTVTGPIIEAAQNAAANVMYKMYGESLKCDIMQVAHHGNKNGANLALYQVLDPSVVFWPGFEAGLAQYGSASNIKYLIDNADKFYFHDMDKGNATITFPDRLTFDDIVGDYGEEGDYIKNY